MKQIDETHDDFEPLARAVASRYRALFDQMTAHEGLPVAAVLAGAHAEIATAMAVFYGGDVAVERMASVAHLVADIPAAPGAALVMCQPAGTA